jgi:hypothetical protein
LALFIVTASVCEISLCRRLGEHEAKKKPARRNAQRHFHRAGLLVNESPGVAGLLFNQSSEFLHIPELRNHS